LDKEIAGYEVINKLLNVYISAVYNKFNNDQSNYDKLILKYLPETISHKSLYNQILDVCHYVSLLSDSKAILNYKKIKGFDF
jgi:dGTPase